MAKHKYIETPEKIGEYFQAYYKHIKTNPRLKREYVGKDGDAVDKPIERPLTIEGFFNFCHREYGVTLEHYWYNSEGSYDEYRTIITRVKNLIREDQLEGGLLGEYNANLTARINGLTEKTDVTTNGNNINSIEVTIVPPTDEGKD